VANIEQDLKLEVRCSKANYQNLTDCFKSDVAEKIFRVKVSDPNINATVTGPTSNDVCRKSKEGTGPQASLTSVTGCSSKITYNWFDDTHNSLGTEATLDYSQLDPGTYSTVKVKLSCKNDCDQDADKTFNITGSVLVKEKYTLSDVMVEPTSATICESGSQKFTVSGTCTNSDGTVVNNVKSYAFKAPGDSSLSQYGSTPDFTASTNGTYSFSMMCGDALTDCIDEKEAAEPAVLTTKSKAGVTNPTNVPNPSQEKYCIGSEVSFTGGATGTPNDTDCSEKEYKWTYGETKKDWSKESTLDIKVANIEQDLKLEVRCSKANYQNLTDCFKSDVAEKIFRVKVIDCRCGDFDGKVTADPVTSNTPDLCTGNLTSGPSDSPSANGVWTWYCDNGHGTDECHAYTLECGVNNTKYLTVASWNADGVSTLCKVGSDSGKLNNGSYARNKNQQAVTLTDSNIDVEQNHNPNNTDINRLTWWANDSGYYNLAKATKWTCVGNDNSVANCGTEIVDCGYASAEQTLSADRKIQPETNNIRYASFGNTQNTWLLTYKCTANKTASNVDDSGRGKLLWTCIDSNNTKINCSARLDCSDYFTTGWMVTSDNTKYSTVRITGVAGGDQCWTAENVGSATDRSKKDMFVSVAADIAASDWHTSVINKGKFQHGALAADSGFNTIYGSCDTGNEDWKMPDKYNWDDLLTSISSSCSKSRLNTANSNGSEWSCSPAGADSTDQYQSSQIGLRDKIGFNAKADENYWSRTSDLDEGKNSLLCSVTTEQNTNVSCNSNSKLGKNIRYCTRSPFYYGFNDTNKVAILSDYKDPKSDSNNFCDSSGSAFPPNSSSSPNYDGETQHQLRCVMADIPDLNPCIEQKNPYYNNTQCRVWRVKARYPRLVNPIPVFPPIKL